MPLTDTHIRNVKYAGKPKKLFDGGGLFLSDDGEDILQGHPEPVGVEELERDAGSLEHRGHVRQAQGRLGAAGVVERDVNEEQPRRAAQSGGRWVARHSASPCPRCKRGLARKMGR